MTAVRDGFGAVAPRGRVAEQVLLFGRNFLRHPRMLGSVVPSSRWLVREVLRQVPWPRVRTVVEYGPGVGTFTGAILERLAPSARLVAIETNPEFARFLARTLPDPRLRVVHDSAERVDHALRDVDEDGADVVLSGIPFSTIDPAVRAAILRRTHDALRPGGSFLVYQFTKAVLPDLRRVFPEVRQGFELRNVMPAHLFYCRRAA